MSEIKNKQLKILTTLFLIPVFTMLFFSSAAIFRDAWFDESITVLNFMLLPGPAKIYTSYVIPNNQIFFTIILKYWIELYSWLAAPATYAFRLPSFLFGIGVLGIICFRWRKRLGTPAAMTAALTLSCSIPFIIYSTAIRGYMLSFLLLALILEAGYSFRKNSNWKAGLLYAVCSYLAVLTIPTNIIGIGALVLFLLFEFHRKKLICLNSLYLAASPLIALLLAYAPIWEKVAGVMKLREGWGNPWSVTTSVYLAVLYCLLPLVIIASFGLLSKRRRLIKDYLKTGSRILILLMPLPFIFIKDPAPFPRVFFIFWVVWLYIFSVGAATAFAYMRKKIGLSGKKLYMFGAILGGVIFSYGILQQSTAQAVSGALLKENQMDDYFSPYYMRSTFKPSQTVKKIQQLSDGQPVPVYITFGADPWSIIFYGRARGMDTRLFGFDNPKFKIDQLRPGILAVLHNQSDIDYIRDKYKVNDLQLVMDNGYQRIYLITSVEE